MLVRLPSLMRVQSVFHALIREYFLIVVDFGDSVLAVLVDALEVVHSFGYSDRLLIHDFRSLEANLGVDCHRAATATRFSYPLIEAFNIQ